jgi:hypothetical protein
LVEVALEYQPEPDSQKEIEIMSATLGQTLEEWAGLRGELAASRRLLCRWLEDRFGSLPDDLLHEINGVTDLERLERAIRQCPTLGSLEELQL